MSMRKRADSVRMLDTAHRQFIMNTEMIINKDSVRCTSRGEYCSGEK